MRVSGQRGFTLVEMLAAVAVLAIAMAAILAGLARYAGNAAHLRERTVGLWVAHNRMTEVQLQPQWPDTGTSDGSMEMAGRTWGWEAEVQKTQDDNLRRIDISVTAPDGAVAARLTGFLSNVGRQ